MKLSWWIAGGVGLWLVAGATTRDFGLFAFGFIAGALSLRELCQTNGEH